MEAAGQHGKAIILVDEQGKEWLLKTFSNIIDFDLEKISDLEVDIEDSPEESRHRMHLWRVMNELTASNLGQRLRLNVPKAIVVCSQKIADLAIKEYQIAASLWYDNPAQRTLYEQRAQEAKNDIGKSE